MIVCCKFHDPTVLTGVGMHVIEFGTVLNEVKMQSLKLTVLFDVGMHAIEVRVHVRCHGRRQWNLLHGCFHITSKYECM